MVFTNPEALGRVMRARRALIQDGNEFYGALAMYLEPVERLDIETAQTDGTNFAYNPDYVMSLSDAALVGLWAHEISHVSLLHHARIGETWDMGEANIAADLAIDAPLIRQGFTVPDAMIDPRYDGMGFEEIYFARQQERRKEQERSGKPQAGQGAPQAGAGAPGAPMPGNQPAGAGKPGNGQGEAAAGSRAVNGKGGIVRPGDAGEAAAEAQAEAWRVRVVEAAAVARRAHAGTLPGELARMVEAAKAPQLDVRAELARFIDSRVVTDITWSRPNRRTIGQGIYLPSQTVDGLEHVVFAVDTSGSIDNHMLANAAAEIEAAHGDGRIRRLTVIYADTKVKSLQEFEAGDEIKLVPAGGGGTRFADTFQRIADDFADATAVIYLTDLEVSDQAAWIEPACPVLFAVHGDSRRFDSLAAKCPFGEAVYIGRLE
ncbi:hydrolase [Mesorhizobium sp. L-8-10]|uniref:vWA domain-containing protein n=1 Tax=Mesorhizobium sp. L-8-10 TaxID=2744523 RepID=UPI0019281CB6|nr:VWA-like domain-containing protein [Mesorhizobium sp. L-8-10]BCH33191.1 hydrolase [Mesorhizobium sp. L-8-10]